MKNTLAYSQKSYQISLFLHSVKVQAQHVKTFFVEKEVERHHTQNSQMFSEGKHNKSSYSSKAVRLA